MDGDANDGVVDPRTSSTPAPDMAIVEEILTKSPPLTPGRKFWIELPRPAGSMPVPKEHLASPSSDDVLDEDGDTDVDEIQEVVGQYTFPDGKKYYYARLRTEIVAKFTPEYLEQYFPGSIEAYEEDKANGLLEDFDPRSIEVRPRDRPPKSSSSKPSTRRSTRRAGRAASVFSMRSEADSEDEEDEQSTQYDFDSPPLRRSSRRRPSRSSDLSPRKTRSRGRLSDESFESKSEEDDSSEYDDERVFISLKKPRRVRRVLTDLGIVHPVQSIFDNEDAFDAPLYKHRPKCSKCNEGPAHLKLARLRKRKGKSKEKRKMREDADLEISEEERINIQGGWLTCRHCCVASHWGCLPKPRRDELLRAIRAKESEEIDAKGDSESPPPKRMALDIAETTQYICPGCSAPGICMGCKEDVPEPLKAPSEDKAVSLVEPSMPRLDSAPQNNYPSAPAKDASEPPLSKPASTASPSAVVIPNLSAPPPLLFRCLRCSRPAHYRHLGPLSTNDEKLGHIAIAESYQKANWTCKDCHEWTLPIDKIIGWRLYPPHAVEEPLPSDQIPSVKDQLPREYLVKWVGRSYRRLEWVPHQFLLANHRQKVANFLKKGPGVPLLDLTSRQVTEALSKNHEEPSDALLSPKRKTAKAIGADNLDDEVPIMTPPADPIAELRIPEDWKLVDRILEVRFWKPLSVQQQSKKSRRRPRTIGDEDEDEDENSAADTEARKLIVSGVEPEAHLTETFSQRKRRGPIEERDADSVVWAYMKWQDLPYDQSTWDTPPEDEAGRNSFRNAFVHFLARQKVFVPTLTFEEAQKRDARKPKVFPLLPQPDFSKSPDFKLKPFQLEGFTWLYENWHNKQASILADEMGLGKTVQIITFIGKLVKELKVFPSVIIVPNSTIANWLREFETWAPHVRVVMYAGNSESRDIIRDYELYTARRQLAYHVLLTTYETATNPKDFTPIIKSVPRWEVLVVDEGQRLKSDSSLLFRRLKEVNSIHRILMTGTPMNNNIREIFNLMNFLDPPKWYNLEELERRYSDLTEELVSELHAMLKPYFLRRVKAEVMRDLPRKHEIIVPISMTSFQKEVWKSIMEHSPATIGLLAKSASNANLKVKTRTNMNNTLMQIRKCMQHPYLVDRALEPPGLSKSEAHKQLINASGKLRFLQMMLPKLKEKGHRVLLFSQFVIALDIIEDFLIAERYKYMRLDGDTPQAQRQKDMDAFNSPESEHFIYILSTRAGGVGINLWSADVVIINDVDFNPHQDLQAIARAHRMGQKKPVLVFTLMIKSSAEERIVQLGKKKLVLDHIVVQNMDLDTTEDVQSILSYGARALFEEEENGASTDTTYSADDIEKLIERVESQASEAPEPEQQGGLSFGFAKIWERQQNTLQDISAAADEGAEPRDDDADFWSSVIERSRKEEARAETLGRGVRRRATKAVYVEAAASPAKNKGEESSEDEWAGEPGAEGDDKSSAGSLDAPLDPEDHGLLAPTIIALEPLSAPVKKPKKKHQKMSHQEPPPSPPIMNGSKYKFKGYTEIKENDPCPLCRTSHGRGDCPLTKDESNVASLKAMILSDFNQEPLEVKVAALSALDEHFERPKKKQKQKDLNLKKRPAGEEIFNDSRKHKKAKATELPGEPSTSGQHSLSETDKNVHRNRKSSSDARSLHPMTDQTRYPPKATKALNVPTLPASINPRTANSTSSDRMPSVLRPQAFPMDLSDSDLPTSWKGFQSKTSSMTEAEHKPVPAKKSGSSLGKGSSSSASKSHSSGPSVARSELRSLVKPSDKTKCAVCSLSPAHELARCPKTRHPQLIREAIKRLSEKPDRHQLEVRGLREILRRMWPDEPEVLPELPPKRRFGDGIIEVGDSD